MRRHDAGEDAQGVARSGFPRVAPRSGRCVGLLRLTSMARLLARFDALSGHGCAVQEPVALVARLHDVTVVREAVQQGCRHLGVPKHARPFGKVQV